MGVAETETLAQEFQAASPAAANAKLAASERVAALYEANRVRIYRFLVGQSLDPATAQELTQEVFVRFFVALSKGTQIDSEQAWLYGVASKLAIDYWRREGRPMWIELDSVPTILENLPSSSLTPESTFVRSERLRRVAREMARLPKEQRLTIHLRMQGLRYRAIAKILGVSLSTAAEWLSIAVERLRKAADE